MSMKDDRRKTSSAPKVRKHSEVKKHNRNTKESAIRNTSPSLPPVGNPPEECNGTTGNPSLVDTTVLRSHSSLSHNASAFKPSPLVGVLADAVDSYHSLPLSMLEYSSIGKKIQRYYLYYCHYLFVMQLTMPNWIV